MFKSAYVSLSVLKILLKIFNYLKLLKLLWLLLDSSFVLLDPYIDLSPQISLNFECLSYLSNHLSLNFAFIVI